MFCKYICVLFSSEDDFGGLLKRAAVNQLFEGPRVFMAHFSMEPRTNGCHVRVSVALLGHKTAWKIVVYISSSYRRSSLMTMGKVYGTNSPAAISLKPQHPLPCHQEGTLWRVRVMCTHGFKHRGNQGTRQRQAGGRYVRKRNNESENMGPESTK